MMTDISKHVAAYLILSLTTVVLIQCATVTAFTVRESAYIKERVSQRFLSETFDLEFEEEEELMSFGPPYGTDNDLHIWE